jgi:hypothetical protein
MHDEDALATAWSREICTTWTVMDMTDDNYFI